MNITWQGVQEWEEYEDGVKLLREINGYLAAMDPYKHPRSTHAVTTSGALFEEGWIDYVVQQSSSVDLAAVEYEMYPVPHVNAEFGYEDSGAGKSHGHHIDTTEFRHRMWRAAMNGQYVTFGNTGTYGGRKFDVDARFADSPGAQQMTHLYDFFTQTRYWDLETYPRVAGGPAMSLELSRFRSETMKGIEYMVYVEEPRSVELLVAKGKYDVSWFNPIDGTWKHEKDKFKGERFTVSGPPDPSHDWVLYVRREGKKEGMNKSYYLESRRPKPKEIESRPSEVPFEIQLPDARELIAGEEYEFNATLTKDSVAAKRTRWVWAAEVPGSKTGYRILGSGQFGKFRIPTKFTDRYPTTIAGAVDRRGRPCGGSTKRSGPISYWVRRRVNGVLERSSPVRRGGRRSSERAPHAAPLHFVVEFLHAHKPSLGLALWITDYSCHLDTTSRRGSVALLCDGELLEATTVEAPEGFAAKLYPEVRRSC